MFSYKGCNFAVQASKSSTARVVCWKDLQVKKIVVPTPGILFCSVIVIYLIESSDEVISLDISFD